MDSSALQELTEKMLDALGVPVDSVSVSAAPRIVIQVATPEGKMLIGERGEALQALNTVARRLAEARGLGEAPAFLIDVNGYHEARLEELRKNARALAERARLFKHEVEMPPMTSYERLVVHELFAEDSEIETASVGEGKSRHVVLRYRSAHTEETPAL